MAYNKIVFGDQTLIDLTEDTVTAGTLAKGKTAHDKSGNQITGTYEGGGKTIVVTESDGVVEIGYSDGSEISVSEADGTVSMTL